MEARKAKLESGFRWNDDEKKRRNDNVSTSEKKYTNSEIVLDSVTLEGYVLDMVPEVGMEE